MGLGKEWPWLLSTALCVGTALSIGAYALGSGTTSVTMLSIALISLCLAQVIFLLRNQFQSSEVHTVLAGQNELAGAVGKLSQEARRAKTEREALSQHLDSFRTEALNLNTGVVEGLGALRESHESLSKDIRSIVESQRNIQQAVADVSVTAQHSSDLQDALQREQQWAAQQQAIEAEPEPEPVPAVEQTPFGEALNLALEPIVDLFTSSTAHYRMVLGMTNEQGTEVPHEIFVHHADRMGLRDKLDMHVVEQALDLLQTLRQRDPNLCIFVPIGAATLATPAALQHILALMRQQPDEASGLVVDIPHAVLASLPEASLEGLATLARGGVALSLSQASIAGVDLSALHRLNVRYVSLSASSIGLGGHLSAGLPGFVQSARAMRVNIIVSHVGDPRQVQDLARTARFASGPAFASPRKLKRTQVAETQYTAAA